MKVIYESSFLEDIQRIDNKINISSCSINNVETIFDVEAIYDKTNKKIRIYLKKTDEIPGSIEKIVFYYKRVEETDDSLQKAFTLLGNNDIVLDNNNNLFEFDLGFYIKMASGNLSSTATIGSKYFLTLDLGDSIKVDRPVNIFSYNIQQIDSEILDGETYVYPESINKNIEIIRSRGILIGIPEGESGGEFSIFVKHENPFKATLECDNNTEDTKFLRGLGANLGTSLYKNYKISENDLVWKDSYIKYTSIEGLKESSDVNCFENSSGQLEVRRELIRSYQNIVLERGSWDFDGDYEIVEKIVEDELSCSGNESDKKDFSFFKWLDPTKNPTIDPEETGEQHLGESMCFYQFNTFLNPGEILYGNTNYLLYSNLTSGNPLIGLKIEGTPGASVDFLFNKDSENGNYVIYTVEIGEDGKGVLNKESDITFVHLNGIRVQKPGIFSKFSLVFARKEEESVFVPKSDTTFRADITKEGGTVDIRGYCDYIDYDYYMGKYKEISRGRISITSIPELSFEILENVGNVINANINYQFKQIIIDKMDYSSLRDPYIFVSAVIKNNRVIENNKVSFENLESTQKVKIHQEASLSIWRIISTPNYEEGGYGIYVLDYRDSSITRNSDNVITLSRNVRKIEIFTNEIGIEKNEIKEKLSFEADSKVFCNSDESSGIFHSYKDNDNQYISVEDYIDVSSGVAGYKITLYTLARARNNSDTWIPKDDENNPYLVDIKFDGKKLSGCSFYLAQRPDNSSFEIWKNSYENVFVPTTDDKLVLYPSQETGEAYNRNFIVVNRETGAESKLWYHIYSSDDYILSENSGESFVHPEGDIIIAGQQGRIRKVSSNANKEDLGVLVISSDSEENIPDQWRKAIVSDMTFISVVKEISDIILSVGKDNNSLKFNYTIKAPKIDSYPLCISSNRSFTVKSKGDARIIDEDGATLLDTYTFGNAEGGIVNLHIALLKFDNTMLTDDTTQGKIFKDSKVIITCSGNTSGEEDSKGRRTIRIEKTSLKGKHSHSFIDQEDEIYVIDCGEENMFTKTIDDYDFLSTSTPDLSTIESSSVSLSIQSNDIDPQFSNFEYLKHGGELTLRGEISNSSSENIEASEELWDLYKLYPILVFSVLSEFSISYSNDEVSPLDTKIYLKGLDHNIWYSESNSDFSELSSSEVVISIDPYNESISNNNVFYLVSRYNNSTFICKIPENTTIARKNLDGVTIEAILNLGEDWNEVTVDATKNPKRIGYCREAGFTMSANTGGNLFLGRLTVQAIVNVSEDRIGDVLYEDEQTQIPDFVDKEFINTHFIEDKKENLDLVVYSYGIKNNIFDKVNSLSEFYDVFENKEEVVFESGRNVTVTTSNITCNFDSSSATYNDTYNYIDFSIGKRLERGLWTNDFSEIKSDCKDKTGGELSAIINYKIDEVEQTPWNGSCGSFFQYGYNYGLTCQCLGGDTENNRSVYYGIGGVNKDGSTNIDRYDALVYRIGSEGGYMSFCAGSIILKNGEPVLGTEVKVPEYEISGASLNDISWTGGILGSQNLSFSVGRNTRRERVITFTVGLNKNDLEEHKYYPTKLEIKIIQEGTNNNYFNFVKDFESYSVLRNINIYPSGITFGDYDEIEGCGKIYFITSVSKEILENKNKISFSTTGDIQPSPDWDFPYKMYCEEIHEESGDYTRGYIEFVFSENRVKNVSDDNPRGTRRGSLIVSITLDNDNIVDVEETINLEQGYLQLGLTSLYINTYWNYSENIERSILPYGSGDLKEGENAGIGNISTAQIRNYYKYSFTSTYGTPCVHLVIDSWDVQSDTWSDHRDPILDVYGELYDQSGNLIEGGHFQDYLWGKGGGGHSEEEGSGLYHVYFGGETKITKIEYCHYCSHSENTLTKCSVFAPIWTQYEYGDRVINGPHIIGNDINTSIGRYYTPSHTHRSDGTEHPTLIYTGGDHVNRGGCRIVFRPEESKRCYPTGFESYNWDEINIDFGNDIVGDNIYQEIVPYDVSADYFSDEGGFFYTTVDGDNFYRSVTPFFEGTYEVREGKYNTRQMFERIIQLSLYDGPKTSDFKWRVDLYMDFGFNYEFMPCLPEPIPTTNDNNN